MQESSHKICTLAEAKSRRSVWKQESQQVVFTNGCFDILHLGHVDYLEKARQTGTKMIVGVNADSSVRQLKGPSRPVNNEYARARILAALEFVDLVIIFEEETPLNLINELLPDILVKGDDYSIDTIVGAKEVIAHGGKVTTIPLVPTYSTTNIIQKLKN
ncbi:MAG: D-glycero-beta-D-manno-heptose 1-phosphate adenylyltransferase [Aquirufa sp.]|jgi:rfaE bifunctional protein nucleotidyltransferase chain/domain